MSEMTSGNSAAADEIIVKSKEAIDLLRNQISHCMVGQEEVVKQTIICLVAGGHALIEGLPGLGKTLLVRAMSKALGGKFNRVQFTPDLMPSDVTGHTMFDTKEQEWIMKHGPIFCNFLLADEVNRAPAKTQSSLLEVMQEQQVTVDGNSMVIDQPFIVLATQNPIEQEGTYPLPEAQLDRFLLNIKIDYPTSQEEFTIAKQLVGGVGDKLDLSSVSQVLEPSSVIEMQQAATQLQMDDKIIEYAILIVEKTRAWNGVEMGASPRGSLALLRCARAQALINGYGFVTPDDVKSIATAVLRHRLRLTADLEIEGYSVDRVIADILASIDAPRI